ncbi:unnamed protein product [Phytomonas sp. Hart1]|nr:unnamed protein product [Phytomonas sp. Hart1]|eukprot:CCW72078.1 unnamed protein product [Phytomonas sp. isolate Hart1]
MNELCVFGVDEASLNMILYEYLWRIQKECLIIDEYLKEYVTCRKVLDDAAKAEKDKYKEIVDSVCDMGQDRDIICQTIVDHLNKGQSSEIILGYLKTLESEMKKEYNRVLQFNQERERIVASICQYTNDLSEPMTSETCAELVQKLRNERNDEDSINKYLNTMQTKLKLEREKRDRIKFENEFYGKFLKSIAEDQGLDYQIWDFIHGFMDCGWNDD